MVGIQIVNDLIFLSDPWKWTMHTKMPKDAQATVLTVLLCAARLSTQQLKGYSEDQISVEDGLVDYFRRWTLGKMSTAGRKAIVRFCSLFVP